jgi:hypothetical protein
MSVAYELYNTMEKQKILLSFKGVVTSELLTSILSIMESKMEYMEERPKVRKKVFNVLVECLQNLYHHIDKDDEAVVDLLGDKSALFTISKHGDNYSITTGNYMDAENVDGLQAKLDLINGMDRDQLKAYYKEVLNNGEMSDKGTAGLGMIDISRKSGQKLEYEFMPISNENAFFSLTVKVG